MSVLGGVGLLFFCARFTLSLKHLLYFFFLFFRLFQHFYTLSLPVSVYQLCLKPHHINFLFFTFFLDFLSSYFHFAFLLPIFHCFPLLMLPGLPAICSLYFQHNPLCFPFHFAFHFFQHFLSF